MIVYKYLTLRDALLTLKNEVMAFSHFDALNDPFDGTSFLQKFNETGITDLIDAITSESDAQIKSKEITSNVITSCFSLVKDNVLMWSHYSNKCTGVIIGFESRQIFADKNHNIIHNFEPTIYHNFINKIDYTQKNETQFREQIYKDLLRKTPDWSYEQEIRYQLQRCLGTSTDQKKKFK